VTLPRELCGTDVENGPTKNYSRCCKKLHKFVNSKAPIKIYQHLSNNLKLNMDTFVQNFHMTFKSNSLESTHDSFPIIE